MRSIFGKRLYHMSERPPLNFERPAGEIPSTPAAQLKAIITSLDSSYGQTPSTAEGAESGAHTRTQKERLEPTWTLLGARLALHSLMEADQNAQLAIQHLQKMQHDKIVGPGPEVIEKALSYLQRISS